MVCHNKAAGIDSDNERQSAELNDRENGLLELILKPVAVGQGYGADCKGVVKRLDKHRYSLFTFLDKPDGRHDNNRAERRFARP